MNADIMNQVDIFFGMDMKAEMKDEEIEENLLEWGPVAQFYLKLEELGALNRIPLVVQLARKVLPAPVSSVYSERLFSEMGNIYEKRKSTPTARSGGESGVFAPQHDSLCTV